MSSPLPPHTLPQAVTVTDHFFGICMVAIAGSLVIGVGQLMTGWLATVLIAAFVAHMIETHATSDRLLHLFALPTLVVGSVIGGYWARKNGIAMPNSGTLSFYLGFVSTCVASGYCIGGFFGERSYVRTHRRW